MFRVNSGVVFYSIIVLRCFSFFVHPVFLHIFSTHHYLK